MTVTMAMIVAVMMKVIARRGATLLGRLGHCSLDRILLLALNHVDSGCVVGRGLVRVGSCSGRGHCGACSWRFSQLALLIAIARR